MTTGKQRRVHLTALAAILAIYASPAAFSQEVAEVNTHWAYSSFFGTGWYKISDTREAFVIKAAPRWTVGEAQIDEQRNRQLGYTFRVPVTVGLTRFDFDDIPGLIDPDNLAAVGIGFGADIDIPVTDRFSLRPAAELGYSAVLDESDSAWTWRAELRSRYEFEAGDLDWALLAHIGSAGFRDNGGETSDFDFAGLTAEFAYPINWMKTAEHQSMLYWHLNYTDFFGEIEFDNGPLGIDSVAHYWELGLAIGKQDQPIKIWFLNFDRLGLAYKYSDTGRLRGIRFVFRSLYDL